MTKTASPAKRALKTLAIDIGGTGMKALVLDFKGKPMNERVRLPTPRPATPRSMLRVLTELISQQPPFDRVSVGFPGVVQNGVVRTAPNLHPLWRNVDLDAAVTKLTKRPTRTLNDAAIQGFGAMEGHGVELTITLGTGLGSALFVDGLVIPLELGHHPWRQGNTYEDELDDASLKDIGKRKWKRRVLSAIEQWQPVFNPRVIYLGGGNARVFEQDELPQNVRIVSNDTGMLGGIALWQTETGARKRG